MTGGREAFLQRVREAVRAGNRVGHGAEPGPRGRIGYQGAGPDPVAQFCEAWQAVGGQVQVVANRSEAAAAVVQRIHASGAKQVLLGHGELLETLGLPDTLTAHGVTLTRPRELKAETAAGAFFRADVGISGVEYLIAETGTLVAATSPDDPRSVSLTPPIHIAVAERSQVLPDLFDLFERYSQAGSQPKALPSCLTLITGPSKTGDIELKLVTGVHGPGEVHVILIDQ